MNVNLEKVMDNLDNILDNCEYIAEEIENADEDSFEDACLYSTSLIDTLIYRLKETKNELMKGIE